MKLKANLAQEVPKVVKSDITAIISHIVSNRIPYDKFITDWDQVIQFFENKIPVCCSKRCKYRKKGTMFRTKENLFENGMARYRYEMNVVNILKALRISKALYRNVLNNEERILMQLQRTSVISSDSPEELETDYGDIFNTLIVKDDRTALQRVFALGKISRQLLLSTHTDAVTDKTARLLKGFYTSNKHQLKSQTDLAKE